jgi:hypothetical protein
MNTTETKVELLPCPFCGGAPRLSGGDCRIYGRNWFSVVCDNCGIWIQDREVWSQDGSGLLDTIYPEMECVARWNNRSTDQSAIAAARDALKAVSCAFYGDSTGYYHVSRDAMEKARQALKGLD